MNKDNGGPAFPVTMPAGEAYKGHAEFDGMTLRDYFAAKALQAIIAQGGLGFMGWNPSYWGSASGIASAAYLMADAMLAERAK